MKRLVSMIAAMCFLSISLTGCVKVIKAGTEAELTGEKSFEETLDVSEFWDSQAVPEIKENAVELKDFLAEAKGEMDSLADKYGHYTMGNTGNINYAVHGTGTVTTVNTEKKAGYIEVALDDYDGAEKIMIQVGPVVKKTSIRDYLSFINVNDFSDQIEYAQLSKEINNFICETVISPVDVEGLEGKQIDFYGCFTYENDDELLITPTGLEVK